MKALSRVPLAVALLLGGGAVAQADDAPARPAAAASAAALGVPPVRVEPPSAEQGREPVVQRTLIDDGRAIIEELRVRGQLVKATVHPKDGSPSYEIIVGDGSRELSEGRNNSRGATGKRVWNVLTF